MKIAIISGASAGLGQKLLEKAITNFPEIDEYWLISRNADKLNATASTYPDKVFNLLPLDLCVAQSFSTLSAELERKNPEVHLLINNAGCGVFGGFSETDTEKELSMLDINISATHILMKLYLTEFKKNNITLI